MRTFPLGTLPHCIARIALVLVYTVGLSQLNLGSRDDSLAYRGSGRLETDMSQLAYRGSGRLASSPLMTSIHPDSRALRSISIQTIPTSTIAHRGSGRISFS